MANIGIVWIAGAGGRLGQALNQLLDSREIEILNTDIEDCDITSLNDVLTFADMNRPDAVINCAGLTDVEECEFNKEKAYSVNALGARNLSIAARKIGARIVHISTDDVFDGLSKEAYTEFDDTYPISVYGKSKLAGERFVRELNPKHIVIRSSWIYGEGNNFLNQILTMAENNQEVSVPDDQFGTPTSSLELARLVIFLMNRAEYGIYHGACVGQCSRYEFAKEIFRLKGISTKLIPVSTTEDQLNKYRPCFTVLDNFMLRISGLYEMKEWKEALAEYFGK